MGNNTMATHAKLTLRFEMIAPTTQDQKLADSVDQNTGNGLDSDDLPSFTPKEKIKLVDRIKVEEKIVEKEKIVYVDRIKVEEKIVEKEKIVYKNAPTPTPEPKKIIKIQLDDRLVHFQTNSSKLTADSQSKIEALAAILKTTRFERLLITGHTDVTGLLSYNIQLSKRRAQSVKNILSKMGLSPKKMLVDGKGPFEPLTSEMTSQGLAKNRRVELHLSGVQENDLPELKSMIEKIWPQTLDQNSTSK
jgi:outer membrane protein OmpA-like peptidoglycan-associated protein